MTLKPGTIVVGEDGLFWRVEHVHQHIVQAVRRESPIMASMREACPDIGEDEGFPVTRWSYAPSGARVQMLRQGHVRRALLLRRDIQPVGEARVIRD